MKVPESCWQGCKGFKLHDGKIDSFDIQSQKWNLLLDDRDEPFPFLMAYEAVYEYADEDSSTYHEYQLTFEAVWDGDEEIETELNRYTKTTLDEWNQKVFQWCLPWFGNDEHLFEFQAARMRNFMQKRVLEEGYTPSYYTGDKVIIGSHIARFYGACLCRMNNGGCSIEQIFSTREILKAVPSIQAAMTKGVLEDLTTCLHYSNNWDPEDSGIWDDIYNDPKVVAHQSTATHR
jgi:hypothetical protein